MKEGSINSSRCIPSRYIIKINKFLFMQINKGCRTNSSPLPTGKKEASAGLSGQFLSALKDDLLDSLIKINLSSIIFTF